MKAGREIRVEPRVIAEVTESQMGQMHADKMNWKRNRGEFFRADFSKIVRRFNGK